ncbi:MAG: UTP--glucose-1-phosphate uridylyltransferase [Verrucomicrobia bacterium]|nr:MAG: UTP--glucose-1-phosphate uridylyltransferase [Verrucomicrobiota bacterium]
MEIKKAIITAAGKAQRMLPLQTLVDRDGLQKTALQIIIGEILAAGVEEICVVVCPGDQSAYANAAGSHARRLEFVEQPAPLGYGHAVWCANRFTVERPFLLLVGDHVYVSHNEKQCAQQLVEFASTENCAASAVQATHESKLPEVIEKPTPTEAEQRLIVPGLRAGHYLCFFGMHVLTPAVMNILADEVARRGETGGVPLSAALGKLAARERYLACELQGRRYDIGVNYGLLTAQLALALAGQDRDEVLSGLVELLAHREARGTR